MVIQAEGGYYAYSTQSGYGDHIWHVPVQRADSPQGSWSALGDAMPRPPAWTLRDGAGHTDIWAPEVVDRNDGTYLLYFTAPATRQNVHCIGTAVATSPAGPFDAAPQPLICVPETHDTNDPSIFVDDDGSHYLLYANGWAGSTIWLQGISTDGLTLVGCPKALIQADRPEEASIVEAPTLTKRLGKYVLFYSGNAYNNGSYFVNYATAPTLDGKFEKHPGALLTSKDIGVEFISPGGQSLLPARDPSSLVFHAFTGPYQRSMLVAGLTWDAEGAPVVHLPQPD